MLFSLLSLKLMLDAPLVSGNIQSRRENIENAIKESNPSITLIPMELCSGLDHVESKLKDVISRKGMSASSVVSFQFTSCD
jgi:hypothetical protein